MVISQGKVMHNPAKSDIRNTVDKLVTLKGGVIDTSTLIYLESLDLLTVASSFFLMELPAAVATEFGQSPGGCKVHGIFGAADADNEVVRLALALGLPVFSDDRKVLMSGRKAQLDYYNTLMLILSLLLQNKISLECYRRARGRLEEVARYSEPVWAFGEAVFSLYVR